jgi:hypothetical protein
MFDLFLDYIDTLLGLEQRLLAHLHVNTRERTRAEFSPTLSCALAKPRGA